ncbi:MAG TPA: hypothetical protein VJC11_00930, partial [Patescibacteria group bacterium]|nr:hypothetical protein [Patescibacteria group bacterium]
MAEEKKEEKDPTGRKGGQQRDSQQKDQSVALALEATINDRRQLVMVAFVTQGQKPLIGRSVAFFCGEEYRQVGLAHQTDPNGKAVTTVRLGDSVRAGKLLVAAKTEEGMMAPVSTVVEVPELAKPEVKEADRFYAEPTFAGYNDQGHSRHFWTLRAFDANQMSRAAQVHLVASRPFYIQKVGDPQGARQNVHDIEVTAKIVTYEITVDTPGLLELDVAMEGRDVKDNNIRL